MDSLFTDFTDYNDCEPAGLELPKIEITKEILDDLELDEGSSSFEVLRGLSLKGVYNRGIDKFENKQEYYDRAKYELEVFERLGFTDYILLNWDILSFAAKEEIPVGDARGSAAGSLVLYLLGVTNMDPIKYGLYFERFVSEARAETITDKNGKKFLVGSLAPDVDTDIAHRHRPKVVDYINKKHKGRTAKILTFNTFSSKLCIKEAVKYFLEYTEEEANFISDMIPEEHGVISPLEKAYEDSERFAEWVDENKEVFKYALVIEGLNKNTSVHASGIAICCKPIKEMIPLHITGDGDLITAYDMDDVADLMVKFDILGLKTLSIADLTCQKIGVKFSDINPEDPSIYRELQNFKYPAGLFQISARTNFPVCQNIKPLNIYELSDVVAISRPAALQFEDEYKKQKANPEKLGINDILDNILAKTKNVLLYQEQTMRACHEVFGMSLGETELLRRAIGKKKKEEVDKYEEKIFSAAKKRGISKDVAEYFWSVVKASADYQFNLSHSISYASLAAKTVWLKAHYPKEFFCSILQIAKDDQKPLETIAEVTREIGGYDIKLLPPQLDKSEMDFSIEGDNLRYGLESVKGVSEKTKKGLVTFTKHKPDNKYKVFDLAKECGINIGVLSSLIYAGALGTDQRLLKALEAQAYNILTDREKRNLGKLGKEFDYKLLDSIVKCKDRRGDDNRLIMTESRFLNFRKKYEDYKRLYLENIKNQDLAIWWFEKKLLGYAYSHPLKSCFVGDFDSVSDIGRNSAWRVVGHVDDYFVRVSARGNRGMTFLISDEESQNRLMYYDSSKEAKFSDWEEKTGGLKKEDIVIVHGNKEWVNHIDVISAKVYIKLRELK